MHRSILSTILVLALAAAAPARAEMLGLRDGRQLDGKIIKEDAQFVWLKTLSRIEKIPVADVVSRVVGESQVEKYEKLVAEAQKEPPRAAALWDLYAFQKARKDAFGPEQARQIENDNKRLLARVLKLDPEHEGARGENGDVRWQGQWVKKSDLERLKAEAARQRLRAEWQELLGVPVDIFEAEHYLLIDNTGDKDLGGRAKLLDQAYATLAERTGTELLWKGRQNVITIKAYDDYVRILNDYGARWNIAGDILASARDRGTGGIWRHKPEPWQLRWPSSGHEGMWSAIVHNTAHVSLWWLWGKNVPPTWLDEGLGSWVEIDTLGQQMATCCGAGSKHQEEKVRGGTTDKQPKKKKPDARKNAESLKEAVNEFKDRCIQAVNDDEFPAMRQFLKMRIGDYGPVEEGGAIGMVTWLLGLDPDRFKTLFALQREQKKRTEDEYWKESFEFQVVEDMEAKFRAWVVSEW